MTDKKLTDNEIKKALECCQTGEDCYKCEYQPSKQDRKGTVGCSLQLMKHTLDYINRLEAENERLENAYKQCAWERDIFAEDMKEEIKKDCSYLMLDIKTIKAEARKEFAERLCEDRVSNDPIVIETKCLLKEMESESNG